MSILPADPPSKMAAANAGSQPQQAQAQPQNGGSGALVLKRAAKVALFAAALKALFAPQNRMIINMLLAKKDRFSVFLAGAFGLWLVQKSAAAYDYFKFVSPLEALKEFVVGL